MNFPRHDFLASSLRYAAPANSKKNREDGKKVETQVLASTVKQVPSANEALRQKRLARFDCEASPVKTNAVSLQAVSLSVVPEKGPAADPASTALRSLQEKIVVLEKEEVKNRADLFAHQEGMDQRQLSTTQEWVPLQQAWIRFCAANKNSNTTSP